MSCSSTPWRSETEALPQDRRLEIIGLGHPDRQDDAVGPKVIEALCQNAAVPGVALSSCRDDLTEILERLDGAEAAIFVDAMRSGARPGQLACFDLRRQALPIEGFGMSSHAFGLGQALALGKTLGKLPPRIWALGVEAAAFETGAPCSFAVARSIPRAVAILEAAIAAWGRGERLESISIEEDDMHEMSLLAALLSQVEAIARAQNAKCVAVVRVKLGALAHISAEHLREHFDEAIKGTVVEGASLEVEQLSDPQDPNAQEIVLESVDIED